LLARNNINVFEKKTTMELFLAETASDLDEIYHLRYRAYRFILAIFDALAQTLLQLNGNNNFHVIDTRNLLICANPGDKGSSNDWLNEIHPNAKGINKLCNKINIELNNHF